MGTITKTYSLKVCDVCQTDEDKARIIQCVVCGKDICLECSALVQTYIGQEVILPVCPEHLPKSIVT